MFQTTIVPRPPFVQDAVTAFRGVDATSQQWAASNALERAYLPPPRAKLDARWQSWRDDSGWMGPVATATVAGGTAWTSTDPFTRTYRTPARPNLTQAHLSFRDDAGWMFGAASSFSNATTAFAGAAGTPSYLMPSPTRRLDSRHTSFVDNAAWIFQAAQSGGQDIPGSWLAADSFTRAVGMWRSTGIYLNSGAGAGAGGIETGGELDPSLFPAIMDFTQTFTMRKRPTLDMRWQSFRGGGFALENAAPIGIGAIIGPLGFMTPARKALDVRVHSSFVDTAPIIFAAADFQNSVSQWMSAMEFQRSSFLMRKRPGMHVGLLETEKTDWIAGSFAVSFNQAWLAAIFFQMSGYRMPNKRYVWPLLTHPVDPQAWIFPVLPTPPQITGKHRNNWPMYLRRWQQLGMRRS